MQALLDALGSAAGPLALLALLTALASLVIAVRARPTAGASAEVPAERFTGDATLDLLLASQMQRIDGVSDEVGALGARTRWLESQTSHAVQHVGLVRFNPYEDTGGNQSFALALLDGDANGIVLSSLHSRQATRLYVKTVVEGRCDAALSKEETEALRQTGLAV